MLEQTTTIPDGRVRNANVLDLPELARLIRGASSTGAIHAIELLDHGHLLVLDLGDRLGAAVHVDLRGGRANLDLLVVDPALDEHALTHRMSSVAHALSEAYGSACVGTFARPRVARRRA